MEEGGKQRDERKDLRKNKLLVLFCSERNRKQEERKLGEGGREGLASLFKSSVFP